MARTASAIDIEHLPTTGPLNDAGQAALRECIDACLDCARACTSCADACLAEADPRPLIACIRRTLDCADVCEVTARVLARQTMPDDFTMRTLVLACAAATAAAAVECLEHAPEHEHCRACAEACRACERACLSFAKESVE